MYGSQHLPPRHRQLPLPLPFPVVKRYPPAPLPTAPAPAVKREPDPYPVSDLGQQARIYAKCLGIVAIVMILLSLMEAALTPEPRLWVRLVRAEGLDFCCEARDQPPLFELAVDVDMIPEVGLLVPEPVIHVGGGGGGDHALRVSYRGVVLAWAAVPRFTISHSLLGSRAAAVVTVAATAPGSVLREDMRRLIWAEQQALGRVEFEADGDIPGLGGHLHCKFYLGDQEQQQPVPPCLVQKKSTSP